MDFGRDRLERHAAKRVAHLRRELHLFRGTPPGRGWICVPGTLRLTDGLSSARPTTTTTRSSQAGQSGVLRGRCMSASTLKGWHHRLSQRPYGDHAAIAIRVGRDALVPTSGPIRLIASRSFRLLDNVRRWACSTGEKQQVGEAICDPGARRLLFQVAGRNSNRSRDPNALTEDLMRNQHADQACLSKVSDGTAYAGRIEISAARAD